MKILRDVDSFKFDDFTVSSNSILLVNTDDDTAYLLEQFLHYEFKKRVNAAIDSGKDLHEYINEIFFIFGTTESNKKFKVIKGINTIEKLKAKKGNYEF